MSRRETTVEIRTWELRERALPRVPPDGWATTDRLREAVCLAVECAVDGVEQVHPFEGPASERERFDATVTADQLDHDWVRTVASSDAANPSDGPDDGFEEQTEQFDLDDALERL